MGNDIHGIILDYGGTLDTGGNHWGWVCWNAYRQYGLPVTEQQFREAYVFAERTLGREPLIQPTDTFRQTLEVKLRLQREYLINSGHTDEKAFAKETCAALVDGLYQMACEQTKHSCEVLLHLKERFPLVLVSNFYGNLDTVLREFGLRDLFLQVVESAVVGIRKPDPRIFQLGIEALGLEPQQVLVVGDSIKNDMTPAHCLGCRTVWLKGEEWSDAAGKSTEADYVITDIRDVLRVDS